MGARRSLKVVAALAAVVAGLLAGGGPASAANVAPAGEPAPARSPKASALRERTAAVSAAAAPDLQPADAGAFADTGKDVPFCQGDIVQHAVTHESTITVALTTGCGTNPSSTANWTVGLTGAEWDIDTDGDGVDDYFAVFYNDGGLQAAVLRSSNVSLACSANPSWNGAATYSVAFPATCIQSPARIRVRSYMSWDENPHGDDCTCPVDVAPNAGWSPPVEGPCAATTATAASNTVPTGGQTLVPVAPARILDTRTGVGTAGSRYRLGGGMTSTVRVVGVGGVPSTGVAAVVLNVTVAEGTTGGYLSVTPGGGSSTSSLNYRAGEALANLVTVPVGTDGNVRIFNSNGCVHVIADVFGYYGAGGSPFQALTPSRMLDTRTGVGTSGATTPIGPNTTLTLQVAGNGGVPAEASAVVLNVTATQASAATFLSVTPGGGASTSNVNVPAGATRPNLVTVPVGSDGQVRIYNSAGTVHVLADAFAWYGGESGALFRPVTPARILDTRGGSPVGPGATRTVQVTDTGGVPASGVDAVLLNTTAASPTASTYLSVTPDGGSSTSNLNPPAGRDIANAVVVKVGSDGTNVRVFNANGSVHVLFDVAGWFGPAPPS